MAVSPQTAPPPCAALGSNAVRETPAGALGRSARLPALDGIRGLAILIVMAYHLTAEIDSARLGHHALIRVAAVGWCGVDLFFVLSGFLITGILCDSKHSANYFRNFYLRRMLRIFPLYYGVLFLVFGLLPWVRPPAADAAWIEAHQGWFWLYGTNVLIALTNPHLATRWYDLSHLWSLAIEEHFYLVWPVVVLAFPRRALVKISVGLVIATMLFRLWLYPHVGGRGVYVLTLCRMDGLALGALLALLVREGVDAHRLLSYTRPTMVACGLALAAIVIRTGHLDSHAPVVQLAGYPLSALASLCLVVEAVADSRQERVGRALGNRFLGFLGKYSYGLYVYHVLLRPVYRRMLPRIVAVCGSYFLSCCVYLALSLLVSVLIAWLSYHCFERHFLRLKERFAD